MTEVTKIANLVPISYEVLHDPWYNPAYGVDIKDDPLGDYNKLITLYRVDTFTNGLKHIPVKTVLYPCRSGDAVAAGKDDAWPLHYGWAKIPWQQRAKTKMRRAPRQLADNIAARLGYQPTCGCSDDDY